MALDPTNAADMDAILKAVERHFARCAILLLIVPIDKVEEEIAFCFISNAPPSVSQEILERFVEQRQINKPVQEVITPHTEGEFPWG